MFDLWTLKDDQKSIDVDVKEMISAVSGDDDQISGYVLNYQRVAKCCSNCGKTWSLRLHTEKSLMMCKACYAHGTTSSNEPKCAKNC